MLKKQHFTSVSRQLGDEHLKANIRDSLWRHAFRTNYIIAALLKWFMDIQMLLCGIAITFYSGICRTPGDVSQPAEWKQNVIQYLRNHYPPTEGIWQPHTFLATWGCLDRWGEDRFSLGDQEHSRISQNASHMHTVCVKDWQGQPTQWHSESGHFSNERLTQE